MDFKNSHKLRSKNIIVSIFTQCLINIFKFCCSFLSTISVYIKILKSSIHSVESFWPKNDDCTFYFFICNIHIIYMNVSNCFFVSHRFFVRRHFDYFTFDIYTKHRKKYSHYRKIFWNNNEKWRHRHALAFYKYFERRNFFSKGDYKTGDSLSMLFYVFIFFRFFSLFAICISSCCQLTKQLRPTAIETMSSVFISVYSAKRIHRKGYYVNDGFQKFPQTPQFFQSLQIIATLSLSNQFHSFSFVSPYVPNS